MPYKHTQLSAALFTTVFCILLTACGGGGSGSNSSSSQMNEALVFSQDDVQEAPDAAKSRNMDATNTLLTFLTDRDNFCLQESNGDLNCNNLGDNDPLSSQRSTFEASLSDNDTLNKLLGAHPNLFAPLRDIDGLEAWWNAGWTGKGVKVAHIDGFAEDSGSFDLLGDGNNILLSHGFSTQFITMQIAPEITHKRWQASLLEEEGFEADGRFERQFFRDVRSLSEDGYHIINASLSNARIKDHPTRDDVYILKSDAEWQREIDRSLALSDFRAVAGDSNKNGALHKNLLLVISAGNDNLAENDESDACTTGIKDCNLWAGAIQKLRRSSDANAGDRVLFVGSVDTDSSLIEDYSVTAGEMTGDFIVAADNIFRSDEDGNGTSQAAPRVVGVAALMRHRWPALTGAHLKQVLLKTADDLGARGPDEIYGHGRLNLENALSPLGELIAQ